MSRRTVFFIGGFYILAAVVLFLSRSTMAEVADSFASVGKNYYFPVQLQTTVLFYLKLPVVFLASLFFWIAPGLTLALSFFPIRRFSEFISVSFLIAFLVQIAITTIGKVIVGTPLDENTFLLTSIIFEVFCWVLLLNQLRREQELHFPLATVQDKRRCLTGILMPVLGVIVLLPFIFWQDFNTDGVEAFEIGNSLFRNILPHGLSGPLTLGNGVIAQAFPYHYFLMLFGPIEASIRLPFLLFLPIIFFLVVELIEWNGKSSLSWVQEAFILFALIIFSVVMCFNTTYSPYFADISEAPTQDNMTILCMLGVLYGLFAGRTFAFFGFAVLAFLCRPSGLLFLMLLFFAVLVVTRGSERKWLLRVGLAILACIVLLALFDLVYIPLVLKDQQTVFASAGILKRMRYLNFFDFKRIAFLIFPCGIIPALALFYFKKQDLVARILTCITLSYFMFFYLTKFVALHHFVPIMILPVIVFWRIFNSMSLSQKRVSISFLAIGGFVSFWLSLPKHFEVNRTVRAIGDKTSFLVGDATEGLNGILDEAQVLLEVVRYNWMVDDPSKELISSPSVLVYYARRSGITQSMVNYVVLPDTAAPPPGMSRIRESSGAILYVRDPEVLKRDRYQSLNDDFRSPLYAIPRETLFRHRGARARNFDFDVAKIFGVR